MRPLAYVALWLLGCGVAVAVAWAGVAVVDSELVNPAPANTLALRENADDWASSTTVADGPSTSGPTTTPVGGAAISTASSAPTRAETTSAAPTSTTNAESTTSAEPTVAPTTSTATTSTAAATTSTAQATTSTAQATTTVAPTTTASTTTTTTTATTTTTTTTTAAPSQTLTFHLVGGSTSVSFSPLGASVLWASPNPGFDVDIDDGPESRVEFESEDHKTRIDLWWLDGPQHEIREDAD